MSRLLFTNVQIFEGTESQCRPGEVLLNGNRISAVAAPGESLPREGVEEIIDGQGATLMPGLVRLPHTWS